MKWIRNIFGNNNPEDSRISNDPEERVKSYISHWNGQWVTANNIMGKDVDFELWGRLLAEVDNLHFAPGCTSGSANSFSSVADHDPKTEKVINCKIDGRSASVETQTYDAILNYSNYFVYELTCDDESNWLIYEVNSMSHPPGDLVVDASKHNEILSLSRFDAPFVNAEENLCLNENILFQKNRSIALPEMHKDHTVVRALGYINLNSGVIGILDFGYDMYDFEPLEQKIQPGKYAVETISIYDRVAGIRIKFNEHKIPTKWVAAKTSRGNGIYGVDGGNLAIFDVQSLMGLSRIEKEKVYNQWTLSAESALLSMTGENDCVITTSGFGDGAYPAFWGLSDGHDVVSIYIDFMILVEEGEDGVFVSV